MIAVARGIARAEYIDQTVPAYAGNPLIEALPAIRSRAETGRLIVRNLYYETTHRDLDTETRRHLVAQIPTFFAPIGVHLDLSERLEVMIRLGYQGRSPQSGAFQSSMADRWVDLSAHTSQSHDPTTKPLRCALNSATSMSIIGPSGIGKSSLLEALLDLYPQVIVHENFKGRDLPLAQITYLKLECPCDGSIKALCQQFFAAVDALLDTNYSQRYNFGRTTMHNLRLWMARVAALQSLGLLVIDEVQHLSAAKSGGEREMLNFFVELVNTIGLPVILVGTYRAQPLLSGEFRQARRAAGQGDFVWDRMAFDDTFVHFCRSLWTYQYVRQPSALDDGILRALYDDSQGITDIIVKLYVLAQRRAMITGTECVDANTIHSVALDSLRLVRPILEAVRTGDIAALSRLDDILPLDLPILFRQNAQLEALIPSVLDAAADDVHGAVQDTAVIEESAKPPRARGARRSRRAPRHASSLDARTQGVVTAVVSRPSTQSAYDALANLGVIRPLPDSTRPSGEL